MSVQSLRRAIDVLRTRARQRALARARNRERQAHSPELLQRLESAESTAAVIAETLHALADSMVGLHPFRRLSQAGWMVGLEGTECVASSGRRPRLARSRIEVCVRIDAAAKTVRLVCRRTVLDRELDALRRELPLAHVSELALAEWVEDASLEFAAELLTCREMLECAQLTA